MTDKTADSDPRPAQHDDERTRIPEHIVEIVSDSGEGAQKAGQAFATLCAKMGNGVWTVEIIPAEIKPPARSKAGASGIRVRFGSRSMSNMGNEADLVVAFNEQVLFGRIAQNAYREGTIILIEEKWRTHAQESIQAEYAAALENFRERGYIVCELPLEEACLQYTDNPRVGKNMFILGMLCHIYDRDVEFATAEMQVLFGRKGEQVVKRNQDLIRGGYAFAKDYVKYRYELDALPDDQPMIVMNGNQAVGLGVMASGMDVVSMYPITPATSASHYLASAYHRVGGCLHQAEDEIAAIGFAVGAAYAGKTSCTITSGPGLALKTEFLGLAVMGELPMVIVVVQRGGPSTGLPTKVEQGDLLAALFGQPGDAPKIVLAAATIEECFRFMIVARKLAEAFRTPVIVLTDANLATGVAAFPRPRPEESWFAAPIDQSPWDADTEPYAWDAETGISPRPIPGRRGGEYVLTGLAHTRQSKVAYDPDSNQIGCAMRSAKMAALQKTLSAPEVKGDETGELLLVGWGSTLGAIEEAVDRARGEGYKVSSMQLRFLSPLPPGLPEIMKRFDTVCTVEINYSDEANGIAPELRRRAQLATLLRAQTLIDIDCWSNVHGQPLRPADVYGEIVRRLSNKKPKTKSAEKGSANVRAQV